MTDVSTAADDYSDADRPINLPAKPEKIWPVSASADGSLNSHCLRCAVTGQGMGYAACLWRQNVLTKTDVRVPADWIGCRDAAASDNCVALRMRREEILADKAIYFRERVKDQSVVTEPKRKWIDSLRELPKKVAAIFDPAPAPRAKPAVDEFDVMAAASDMAAVATRAGAVLAPVSSEPPKPAQTPVTARADESPLQMAMRIKQERAAAQAQAQ